LILGDQLNSRHSWFKKKNPDEWYLMMEIRQETDYVNHHIQKVTAIFQSMRLFAQWLKHEGHQVIYLKIGDKENFQNLEENIRHIISKKEISNFEYLFPDEYRLDIQLKNLCNSLGIKSGTCDTEHFLSDRLEVKEFFKGNKKFLMEPFYRYMRKKFDILMEGEKPVGGKWNFDHENRKKLPDNVVVPPPPDFQNDVTTLVDAIQAAGVHTIGEIIPSDFRWPRDRDQALRVLNHFCKKLLPDFGNYQDAMHDQNAYLFHSKLSFALNVKLIHPLEVIKAVESCWRENPKKYALPQVEGFIRQILGWREYMRGIYWAHMPGYGKLNFFDHQKDLPEFYWTGNTRMNCVGHAIRQSLDHAYAHHIQRLMITGNFALLAGIHPDQVDHWYLGIYIDAFQWVEITNTRGMSQFA
ncbi:MAG: cryptochrome/photolyase family protein, partial [Cyclobacteriaceae bacterium]